MPQPMALITGGTSGIGAAFAEALGGAGVHLILHGRRDNPLRALSDDLAARHGISVRVITGDLRESTVVDTLVGELGNLDQLDYLVNNAGFDIDGLLHEVNVDESLGMMRVHMDATVRLCHAALGAMVGRRAGNIINVSSLGSFVPAPWNPVYVSTKAFVTALSESLHVAYAPHGINVQALCPGITVTEMHQRMGIDPKRFYKASGLQKAHSAEFVVAASLKALSQGKPVVVPGGNYKLVAWLAQRMPRKWLYRVARSEAEKFLASRMPAGLEG